MFFAFLTIEDEWNPLMTIYDKHCRSFPVEQCSLNHFFPPEISVVGWAFLQTVKHQIHPETERKKGQDPTTRMSRRKLVTGL